MRLSKDLISTTLVPSPSTVSRVTWRVTPYPPETYVASGSVSTLARFAGESTFKPASSPFHARIVIETEGRQVGRKGDKRLPQACKSPFILHCAWGGFSGVFLCLVVAILRKTLRTWTCLGSIAHTTCLGALLACHVSFREWLAIQVGIHHALTMGTPSRVSSTALARKALKGRPPSKPEGPPGERMVRDIKG